jgi:multidrug efflux pump
MKPMAAAVAGAREIGFTVLSISFSLVAVFIPILCMGGIVGRLFREFAVTLSVAIGVSMVVSLTLTPMMCAWLLRPASSQERGWADRWTERGLTAITDWYARALAVVMRHPRLTMAVNLATMALTVYLYVIVPKGFFPQQDNGRITATLDADQDTSFQTMSRLLTTFSLAIHEDPAVAGVTGSTGAAIAPAAAGAPTLRELMTESTMPYSLALLAVRILSRSMSKLIAATSRPVWCDRICSISVRIRSNSAAWISMSVP